MERTGGVGGGLVGKLILYSEQDPNGRRGINKETSQSSACQSADENARCGRRKLKDLLPVGAA